MRKRIVIFTFALLSLGSLGLLAGEQVDETKAEVRALAAFHDIIYPIWHTAYPTKDYAALRGFAPEVKAKAQDVLEAKLPGILRDRQAKWDAGLAEFNKSVEDYLASAAGGADEALWNAAEVLHARYEMLVRIIRPVLKEIDEFHQELYVVYHRHLPGKDWAALKAAAPVLVQKAEAVTRATLSKRFESRLEVFGKAAQELHLAARGLESACAGSDTAAVEKAVELVHSRYQALEKVFE